MRGRRSRAVDPTAPRAVEARESGVVTIIGTEALVAEAERADCVLELVPALGAFAPFFWPSSSSTATPTELDEDRLLAALSLKLEPTLDEDVAYGMRLLVDIAERSLSESPFQDPTTAVQAIDRLHDILRQLARRPFADGRVHDERGELRLPGEDHDLGRLRPPGVRRDPARWGGLTPGVASPSRRTSSDLSGIALPTRVQVLDDQLDLLRAATTEAMVDERDVRFGLDPDREGLGAAAP